MAEDLGVFFSGPDPATGLSFHGLESPKAVDLIYP